MTALEIQGKAARAASRRLAVCSTQEKNAALLAIARALNSQKDRILAANDRDMKNAVDSGMSRAMQDRLALTPERIDGIVEGVRQVVALPDPIGEAVSMLKRPNGLTIAQVRVPLGVIAMIYESRPNVTVDSAVLCLKSGNAVILRGGKEAFESNKVLVDIMREAIAESGLPADCISLVQDTSRESATELMRLHQYVDLLIPRGGAGLIRSVVENATVPVIETGVGNCHIYVDDSADLDMAVNIVRNAKCSRPSVCNAVETLLVSRSVAGSFLPMLKPRLDEYNVELRGDDETAAILGSVVVPASEEDWDTEYGDYILAIKIVSGIDEAMEHIAKYGTGHSEAIITSDYANSQRFLQEVAAAAVYVNASTRFTDGGEFGLGAEIGISTQKMHARGPMGLRELTSSKYIIYGSGQIR
ncbi:MAG TPA: glutamate-5-semialdehyde dehydrogenase [Clostridiales bacterium]|nr:glutamate-5-semialdehyde dehydrogenase [Clostridiales bacterium]